MIKHVLFDLGGVLVNLNYEAFFKSLAELFHISVDELARHKGNELHFEYMRGMMDGKTYVDKIARLYNHEIKLTKFLPAWVRIIDGQKDDVAKIVFQLQPNVSLSLLSNTDPWHYEYCMREYPVMLAFSRFFLSFQYKFMKPDAAFYQAVNDKLAVKPDECVFIDDTLENIESARNFGWYGIHFQSAEQLGRELVKLKLM
ncbi:HAD family phosphatase [candidate division KSB1 bacterium]|nr:HAD family phosphatase [candidate division KSB1 bacterium]